MQTLQENRKLLYSAGLTALLIAVVAMGMVAVQPAAATGASTQTTDQAEFGNVTAEVTKETLFTGKVSKVKVTYTAPEGETVDITVAGETETVTADGTESEVTLIVGAFFFFGESYPVDVSASIQGGESVSGTINADDGVIPLNSVAPSPTADFQVSNLQAPAEAIVNDTITVSADVQNTGDQQGTQSVTFGVDTDGDGSLETLASQSETLASGASTTVTFNVDTTGLAAGTYTHGVSTANDTATAQITLNPPPTPANFQVSNLQAPAEATVNDTITVSADVQNTGDQQGTQSVAFGVDTDGDGSLETLASQDETLAGGASTTVTFDVDTTGLAAGTYTHGVSTANDTATAQITLNPQPTPTANFQVSNLQAPAEATVNSTITVSADVQNDGDAQGTQSVAFGVDTDEDGSLETLVSQDETLASGASTTVTFNVNTTGLVAGTYTHGVSTANDTATAQITLNPETVNNGTIAGTVTDAAGSALPGATVTAGDVSTTTASDGSYSLSVAPGEYQVTANANNYQSATASATVTEGSTTTVDFSLTPEDGTISGVVQDTNGNNLGGATVTAGSQSATTASNGSYTLTVAPGTYTVEASAQDYNTSSTTVSVGPGEDVTQDFTLEMQDMGPKPFTAYVRGEESYLQTGTPNNSRPILYSTCRDGVPSPAEQGPDFLPTDGCIQINGTIYPSNNTWRGDVDFPPARDIINETQSDTIGNIYFRANLSVVGQAGGTFNVDTGRTSLETTVDIGITVWNIDTIFSVSSPAQFPYDQVTSDSANRLSDPGCNLPAVSINVSTEKSYQTGSPFPATSTVSGQRINDSDIGKLVSDDFDVSTAEGCGSVFGVNINDQVNAEQGLPAGPGDNEAAYLTEFNIQTGS